MAVDVEREEFEQLEADLATLTNQLGGGYVGRTEYRAGVVLNEDRDTKAKRDIIDIKAQISKLRKLINIIVLQDKSGGVNKYQTLANYDSNSREYLYIGKASTGEHESTATWKIERYDFTNGSTSYADGNINFDNIWANRESLVYS
jgi:hypothetical protein